MLSPSCGNNVPYITRQGFTQGTTYKVIYGSPDGKNYDEEIEQLLLRFNASLSIYDPNSLISRINRNDTTALTDEFFRTVFGKAEEIHKASSGVFDITVAPLVNLWGFGFTSDQPEPDAEKIDSLLQYVGMDKVRLAGNRLEKDADGIMLDVNAIAKGYSVDVVANFLEQQGCHNYLVEIGGEVVARGVNTSGDVWRIGIDRPDENTLPGENFQAIICLKNRALATSGNYRRFFEIDGVKYAHSIDVKTGYPVQHNLLSATIIAADCITADAWATVCMVSGLEKSVELLRQHPEFDALLIYSDNAGNYQTYSTAGLCLQ
jgi:thiamine biosynthesis lipoprotein